MPWRPLTRMAFAVATYPFTASSPADMPLEIGDELYIIEQGGHDGSWFRGYLVAPPSLLAGLTSIKGQTLEARVFSGIFPRCCVEVRELLGDPLIDGQPSGSHEVVNSVKYENTNGDLPKRTSSLAHRTSIRRKTSNSSSVKKSPLPNGEPSKIVGSPERPTRSTSQRFSNQANGQDLRRQLSHRSFVHNRTKSSSLSHTRISDTHRDHYVNRPQAPVPMLKIGDETSNSSSEPLVDEIASCLREWHSRNLHELLLGRHYSILEKISDLINRLYHARRQLLHEVLTDHELSNLREEIVWHLVNGNKLLSKEVIVRDPKQHGRLLTGDDSAIEMTKLQSTMSLLDRPPTFQPDPVNLYHLMVDVKSFGYNGLTSPTATLYLCMRSPGESTKTLTESFIIDLPAAEDFTNAGSMGKLRTLFTDLTANDIGDISRPGVELYLVLKIQASQPTRRDSISSSPKVPPADENASFTRTATKAGRSSSSVKGGRQSLMWAQKQFSSTRSRSQPDSPMFRKPSMASPPSSMANGARPATRDGIPSHTQENSRPTTQQGTQNVKRIIGVGVVPVKHLFLHATEGDQHVTIWSPSASGTGTQKSMDGWDDIVRDLIPTRSGAYTKSKSIDNVRLGFQSFANPDAFDLINKTPTLLQYILTTPRIDFPGAPTKARSDIYVKISEAVLPHQALLSHPERGTVQISSSLDLRNVQLTLEVRKRSGERIERCIFPGSNITGQTAWRTCAVERGEPWNQMIKLVVPIADVPEAHLIMSIAEAPGFPFALAWIPLWNDDAFIKDGGHAPLLYLYDKLTSSSDKGRGAYLAFPWDSKGKDGDTMDETLTGPIATLRLETSLCSTFFSQDTVLLGVLHWREQSAHQLLDLLKRFNFVPEIEIVKLVSDVLDSLFGIMVEYVGQDQYEDAIFNALITVLGISHDRRFNLGPFVDDYAETRFDYPFASPCLIRSYFRLLEDPADQQKARHVRAAFKVGRQILRFIICARKKQEMKESDIGTDTQATFKHDVTCIFNAFNVLMLDSSPTLVGSKTMVVQHMHEWLPELKPIFLEDEISKIAINFLASCKIVHGRLTLYKLVFILHLIDSQLFIQEEVRQKISELTAQWIEPYWGLNDGSAQWPEQVRLCCSIVASQIKEPCIDGSGYFSKAVQSYRSLLIINGRKKEHLSIMYPTTYPFPSKPLQLSVMFEEALIELAGLLAELATTHKLFSSSQLASERIDVLLDSFNVITSVISGDAIPKCWLSLYMFHHRSSLQTLELLFDAMVKDYIPSPDDADEFNTDLWSKYLLTLLTLVRSDALALETFPEQKRRTVWKIAGDVREQGAHLLKRCWESIGWEPSAEEQRRYGLSRLGGFQVQYVPTLVAPVVELCMSVHEGLRNVAVNILQAMIISEWTLNEDLAVIQAEMIDCFEVLFKTKNLGESLVQKMFVNELLDRFESIARTPLDPLWQAIKDMIRTIDELLALLAAVYSPDITETLQIMNTLELMNFLKDMNKEDIFIRYVHQLAQAQAKLNNRTQAGLALRLHADLYTWERTKVGALTEPAFPEQSSFERKEQIYFEMIKCFEEGESWDSALASYRELADQYERSHYDFAKLARAQRAMATIYETIMKGELQWPRFFRVAYYGLGFPSSLRGKQFIYDGDPSERQSTFTDRIRQIHPSAQVVTKIEHEELEGQYIQISPVTVYRDIEHPIYQESKVAQPVRDYVSSSYPYQFAFTSKRFSPASDVHNQWVEKTVYSTKESFPTIQRRSEIVAIEPVRLSPLQTALERTIRKTSELAALEKRRNDDDDEVFDSLTEAILSSVDPSSAATVAQYRQLLPVAAETSEEDAEQDQSSPLQDALQIALLDHVVTLKQCLSHYMRPDRVHNRAFLLENLQETFAPELAILAPKPAAEPNHHFSSPPQSAGSFSAPSPILTNGSALVPPEQTPESDSRPRPLSRLSFNFKKTSSSPALPQSNGTPSIPSRQSEDGSSSGQYSQAVVLSPGQKSVSASVRSALNGSDTASSTRPMTAHSGRSGKLKKRLSSFAMGRMGSASERPMRGEAMGGVMEE